MDKEVWCTIWKVFKFIGEIDIDIERGREPDECRPLWSGGQPCSRRNTCRATARTEKCKLRQAGLDRQASGEEEIQEEEEEEEEEEEMQTRVLMYYICNICVCMVSNDFKCSRV